MFTRPPCLTFSRLIMSTLWSTAAKKRVPESMHNLTCATVTYSQPSQRLVFIHCYKSLWPNFPSRSSGVVVLWSQILSVECQGKVHCEPSHYDTDFSHRDWLPTEIKCRRARFCSTPNQFQDWIRGLPLSICSYACNEPSAQYKKTWFPL